MRSTRVTLLLPLALILLPGCAGIGTRTGLIQGEGLNTHLKSPEGREYKLVLGQESRPLGSLQGCLVELEGAWFARRLFVTDWRVTDGGDGSTPFLGVLRLHGSNLVLDDRNSGMPILFDAASEALLRPHQGSMVMVTGFALGPQIIHVVTFRELQSGE